MLNNEGLNNPIGWGQRQKKNLEMITEMAKVGYGNAINHLDVDRVYYPIALAERAKKDSAIVDGFLQFVSYLQTVTAGQLPNVAPGREGDSTITPTPKPPRLPGA